MARNHLPLYRRRAIKDNRQNLLIKMRFVHPTTKLPSDLSAYALEGGVALTKGGPVIAPVTFDNDLSNGEWHGYLTKDDSKTVVDAALAAKVSEVFWDIKATATGEDPRQWAEGVGQPDQVVTP